jgi:hypothetical protein
MVVLMSIPVINWNTRASIIAWQQYDNPTITYPHWVANLVANTRRLALHDVGRMAEGDAFVEEESHTKEAVVDGAVKAYVLHRVLYPGVKKKNTTGTSRLEASRSYCLLDSF